MDVVPPIQKGALPVQATVPAFSDSNAPVITQAALPPAQAATSVVNETTAPCAAQAVAPPPARSRTVALTYTNTAYAIAEGEQGNMKEFLRDVLTEMYQ